MLGEEGDYVADSKSAAESDEKELTCYRLVVTRNFLGRYADSLR